MYPALAAVFQLLGAAAIFVSLVGTWMAARHRGGWLLCVVSSTMWFPALIHGNQWAAVANCVLSIAICARNFQAQDKGAPNEVARTGPLEMIEA